jgi:nitrilase
MKPIITSCSTQTALEARCFVVVAGQVTPTDDPPGQGGYRHLAPFVGGSGVVGPHGGYLAGPIFGEETIVHAELDRSRLARAASLYSPFGKDGRPDLFTLRGPLDSPEVPR